MSSEKTIANRFCETFCSCNSGNVDVSPDDNRHPLLVELLEHVNSSRLFAIAEALEGVCVEDAGGAVQEAIVKLLERKTEELLSEDREC